MGMGRMFENELDFGPNSRPNGVFVHAKDGDNRKFTLNISDMPYISLIARNKPWVPNSL